MPRLRLPPPANLVDAGSAARLSPEWETAFGILAEPVAAWRIRCGTPDGSEQEDYYAAASDPDALVACTAGDGTYRIRFPAAQDEIFVAVEDWLRLSDQDTWLSGLRYELRVQAYAALLAAAECVAGGENEPVMDATSLIERWQRKATPGSRGPLAWGLDLAPAPIQLDEKGAARALASLSSRLLVDTGDFLHFTVTPHLSPVLDSLAAMQRYAAIDLWTEQDEHALRRDAMVFIQGAGRVWVFDFLGDRGDKPAFILRPFSHFDMQMSFGHLVELVAAAAEAYRKRTARRRDPRDALPRPRYTPGRIASDTRALVLGHLWAPRERGAGAVEQMDILRDEGRYAWGAWWREHAGTNAEIPEWVTLLGRIKADRTLVLSPGEQAAAWKGMLAYLDLEREFGGMYE